MQIDVPIGFENKEQNKILLKNLQSNLINSILDKYIEKSFLSHWKSAIENIVLENKQNRFKEIVKSMKAKNSFISTKLIKEVDWENLNEEGLINILMCYILYDKSSFYKNENGKLEDFKVSGPSDFKKLRDGIISKYN